MTHAKALQFVLSNGDEEIATRIESLTAQLAAQAEVSRKMREALAQWASPNKGTAREQLQQALSDRMAADAALALTPTEAEQRAASNAEKAELLDWLLLSGYAVYCDMDQAEDRYTVLRSWQDKYKYATPHRWFDAPLDAIRAAKKEAEGRG